ncbi:MAG: hypothetical protein K8S94_17825 [Planctomycetia bacterium]|nr:hypothetical protein [Planctomycetia bacterium]
MTSMNVSMSRVLARMAVALGVAVAVCGGGGCGNSKPLVVVNELDPSRGDLRLIQLGTAYRDFCSRTSRAPKNIGELEPVLKDLGITDYSPVSPRDGKPFEVAWGVFFQLVVDPDKPPTVLAHEAIGQDGSRYVLWDYGMTELLSDEKFDRARRGGESGRKQ